MCESNLSLPTLVARKEAVLTETVPSPRRTSLPLVCEDYDSDCREMSFAEAKKCFEGGRFRIPSTGETAELLPCDGGCPILSQLN